MVFKLDAHSQINDGESFRSVIQNSESWENKAFVDKFDIDFDFQKFPDVILGENY